jgi:Uma2 family endonuclease
MQQVESALTLQEYLTAEREAEIKSEYIGGEIFAIAGASREHNLISTNIVRVLGNQLPERPCNVYANDMKIKVERAENYFYPDIIVSCKPEEFEDEKTDVLLNPLVIMEILSDSTEAYDRGQKFACYQLISSFTEYTLITQNFCRVENFKRQDDTTWLYSEFRSMDDVISLDSVNCELAVAEIYRKVNLRQHHSDIIKLAISPEEKLA